jgi:hypothetical protein
VNSHCPHLIYDQLGEAQQVGAPYLAGQRVSQGAVNLVEFANAILAHQTEGAIGVWVTSTHIKRDAPSAAVLVHQLDGWQKPPTDKFKPCLCHSGAAYDVA